MLFIKETDTFGHIVVWTIYTSHTDHFTPQHTVFEQSTACLSVFLESLSGLIPFARVNFRKKKTAVDCSKALCMKGLNTFRF